MVTPPATRLRALFEEDYLASKSPGTRSCYLRSIERLEAWARREALDLGQLQTDDLRRFLAEHGRANTLPARSRCTARPYAPSTSACTTPESSRTTLRTASATRR